MMTFRGVPVFFDQHAWDGANAEETTEEDVLRAMEEGLVLEVRKNGRVTVELPRKRKFIIVRYDTNEDHYYVVSGSRRRR